MDVGSNPITVQIPLPCFVQNCKQEADHGKPLEVVLRPLDKDPFTVMLVLCPYHYSLVSDVFEIVRESIDIA